MAAVMLARRDFFFFFLWHIKSRFIDSTRSAPTVDFALSTAAKQAAGTDSDFVVQLTCCRGGGCRRHR